MISPRSTTLRRAACRWSAKRRSPISKRGPNYALNVGGALVGFIEVKAPGRVCNRRKLGDPHEKAQWGKLK